MSRTIELYLENGEKASLEDVCKWWIKTYPADVGGYTTVQVGFYALIITFYALIITLIIYVFMLLIEAILW